MEEQATKKSWISRHWKKILVFAILLVPLVLFGATSLMKSSMAFKISMQEITTSKEIQNILGTPIKDNFFVSGTYQTSTNSGYADLSWEVSGPQDSASVHSQAVKSFAEWELVTLDLKIESTSEIINLLDKS